MQNNKIQLTLFSEQLSQYLGQLDYEIFSYTNILQIISQSLNLNNLNTIQYYYNLILNKKIERNLLLQQIYIRYIPDYLLINQNILSISYNTKINILYWTIGEDNNE